MLRKEEPDIAYITTPVRSHLPIVSTLIQSGIRSIFIEKPPVMNSKELDDVLNVIDKDQITMVGFQKRFALTFRHAKLLIDKGVIGDIKRVSSSIKSSDIITRTTRFDSIGRGAMLDLGIHLIDLLSWMFDINDVKHAASVSLHTNVDDSFKVALRTTQGADITVDVTWSSKEHRLPETYIEIQGSQGTIVATDDYVRAKANKEHFLLNKKDFILYKPYYYGSSLPVNVADPEYTFENIHFFYCIDNHIEPITSLKNSVKTIKLIDKVYVKSRGEMCD